MPLGDGIRRNIAHVEPAERALLRDAIVGLNQRFFPGTRNDPNPGGVSWWFKQDEIHQATHVHGGPEFLPWHREICNRLEAMLRQVNPQLSLHYWDWTQDPGAVPNANLGGGVAGVVNLFTPDFMGHGGNTSAPIGEPWLTAGFYVPTAALHRDATQNPADPPSTVTRFVNDRLSPAAPADDQAVLAAGDYADMRAILEDIHDRMHSFVAMGGQHVSFRDPFVFLLHSNVDRLLALWQTAPGHPERLQPATVYGTESNDAGLNGNIEPWAGGTGTRPGRRQTINKRQRPTRIRLWCVLRSMTRWPRRAHRRTCGSRVPAYKTRNCSVTEGRSAGPSTCQQVSQPVGVSRSRRNGAVMSVKETVQARLRKLLRDEFSIDITKSTPKSTLGESPMGFDDTFIDTEFRDRTNDAFDDLVEPFPPGTWDGESSLGAVGDEIIEESGMSSIAKYRSHVTERVDRALTVEEVPETGVPVARREEVRDALNESLAPLLLRDVALKDLAGSRENVRNGIVARMII
jgi:hypothetical protein